MGSLWVWALCFQLLYQFDLKLIISSIASLPFLTLCLAWCFVLLIYTGYCSWTAWPFSFGDILCVVGASHYLISVDFNKLVWEWLLGRQKILITIVCIGVSVWTVASLLPLQSLNNLKLSFQLYKVLNIIFMYMYCLTWFTQSILSLQKC